MRAHALREAVGEALPAVYAQLRSGLELVMCILERRLRQNGGGCGAREAEASQSCEIGIVFL